MRLPCDVCFCRGRTRQLDSFDKEAVRARAAALSISARRYFDEMPGGLAAASAATDATLACCRAPGLSLIFAMPACAGGGCGCYSLSDMTRELLMTMPPPTPHTPSHAWFVFSDAIFPTRFHRIGRHLPEILCARPRQPTPILPLRFIMDTERRTP